MMAALLLAELRRITTRRLVRVTVLLTVVGIAFGGLAAYAFSGSLSEAAYQQRVEEAKERQIAFDEQVETCLRDHGFRGDGPVPEEIAEECFPDNGPAGVDDPRFTRNRLEGILYGVSGALAVVGWALGASLVGAEFASRGMTTLLTWETRRARVFAAKTAAAVGAMAVFAFFALGLVVAAMWPALALHGAPLQPDDPSLWSLAGIVARAVALTAITSAMGLAIATIGRNTAVALGAGFAYIIVLENIPVAPSNDGGGGCCWATSSSSWRARTARPTSPDAPFSGPRSSSALWRSRSSWPRGRASAPATWPDAHGGDTSSAMTPAPRRRLNVDDRLHDDRRNHGQAHRDRVRDAGRRGPGAGSARRGP
jgi:hypothetical protein